MSTPTIHRISDRQPEFPCWLWHNEKGEQTPFGWVHRMGGYVLATRLIEFGFTHWHPDQPEAPTPTPPTEQATEGEINAPTTEAWMKRIATAAPAVAQGETQGKSRAELDVGFAEFRRELNEAKAELDKEQGRAGDLEKSNERMAKNEQRRVEDFLNDKACCSGRECGCMGVTRLQQMVEEEAGTQLATLRQSVARLTSERDQARQDLEERCAENDRERSAHLQAYQAAVKERDEARRDRSTMETRHGELVAELAELRKDRDGSGIRNDLAIAEGELKKYRDRLAFLGNPKSVFLYSVAPDGQIKVGSRYDYKLFPSMEQAIDASRNQQENRE